MFRFVLALIVLALVSATAQATGLRSENEQLTAAAKKVSEKKPPATTGLRLGPGLCLHPGLGTARGPSPARARPCSAVQPV